jgi:hypothetical protein
VGAQNPTPCRPSTKLAGTVVLAPVVKSSVYATRMRMKCSMGVEPTDEVGGNSVDLNTMILSRVYVCVILYCKEGLWNDPLL